jgi:3-deoxy-D-manno-octulosonate 8-phosphate phosphatase (KDO 8-P phosphatase)
MNITDQNIIQKINNVRCIICDVDGVLTNGLLYINEAGQESKAFHVHDGMGLKFLLSAGFDVAIITTTHNTIIDTRMEQLGIQHFYKGQVNKQAAFDALKNKLNLPNHAFAYIGDDLPDLPIMQQVGLSIAVANAVDPIIQAADLQTQKPGGAGAVREICDLILTTQHKLDYALDQYLTQ